MAFEIVAIQKQDCFFYIEVLSKFHRRHGVDMLKVKFQGNEEGRGKGRFWMGAR